jgi:glucosyl-3-phosphoglycerate synthase
VDAQGWFDRHTTSLDDWRREDLIEAKASTRQHVAVVLPALDEEGTVGEIVTTIRQDLVGALVDEVIVVDSGSTDATAPTAQSSGARVVTASRPGKGAALWHGVAATDADLVVFVDADLQSFSSQFVVALLGPLLTDPETCFVKAAYDRPAVDPTAPATGGGRVTELMARPLIAAFWPELNGVLQPLAGEYAGRRSLLAALPFRAGYGVDIGLLIDTYQRVGLAGMAQVDLHRRLHRNARLPELGRMAAEILHTAAGRLTDAGRLAATPPPAVELWQPARLEGGVAMDGYEIDVSQLPPVDSTASATCAPSGR